MKIFRGSGSVFAQVAEAWYQLDVPDWDVWFAQDGLYERVAESLSGREVDAPQPQTHEDALSLHPQDRLGDAPVVRPTGSGAAERQSAECRHAGEHRSQIRPRAHGRAGSWVRIMGQVQLGVDLTDAQVADLVAFLGALEGELPAHARLPTTEAAQPAEASAPAEGASPAEATP